MVIKFRSIYFELRRNLKSKMNRITKGDFAGSVIYERKSWLTPKVKKKTPYSSWLNIVFREISTTYYIG